MKLAVRLSVALVAATRLTAAAASLSAVEYVRDIKPLLRERCYACHGALKQKADLRLDTVAAMLRGGRRGAVVRPGHPEDSRIVARVTATDMEERMPPEHEGEPLKVEQIKLLQHWIAAGAPAPADESPEVDPREHWAFRAVQRPPVPAGPKAPFGPPGLPEARSAGRNAIDAFIAEQLGREGLAPVAEAPREVLLRRLYFDLIGLPPSEEDLAAAAREETGDWYEKTVERLLADVRHGERWARHWMDVWRFSDWWGLGDQLRNSQKHIWHWRDWLVEASHADMPYDEMIRLMLAADELHPNDLNRLRATGFLARNWFLFNRNQWMEETVEHVSKGFLGLTLNCAKCHDHKYDPLPQADFYRMRAFFEPYHVRQDVLPGEPDLEKNGLPRVYDGPADTPTYRYVRGQESQPDKSTLITPGVPALLEFAPLDIRPVLLPVEASQPERRNWVGADALSVAQRALAAAEATVPPAARELTAALRREAELVEQWSEAKTNRVSDRPAARDAVESARHALAVAESSLALARAELESVESRLAAMRAEWATADASGDATRLEAAKVAGGKAAVVAERAEAAARARHTVVEIERRLAKTASDKKEPVEKELKAARDTLAKAVQRAVAPVQPEDAYTRLVGARWAPTRFLNSTKDDLTVPFPAQSSGRRRALAEWLADRRNPLTARVAVNHVWMRHFGTPLVATPFEFGRKGAPPTHPALLDWLAAEFMENRWSLKHLHRMIVMSATYRMSSSLAGDVARANTARDPDNIHLWRRAPVRLEAEAVRDSLLVHAGTLDPAIGGPPVLAAQQADSKRRSLYFFHSNNDRNVFLTTFDAPAVKECYRRDQSIVPQQALALTNSRLVQDAADAIADRLERLSRPGDGPITDDAFIARAFRLLLGINAGERELVASRQALESWRQEAANAKAPDVARSRLVHVLINHNDFVTVR